MARLVWPILDVNDTGEMDVDWHTEQPRSHHPSFVQALPDDRRRLERARGGRQLLRSRSFRAPCARDRLTLCVHLPTPEEARKLMPEAEMLASGMHGMEVLLLQQFIEKDYGDDLLLLTATEEPSGHLVGMIFWRYLRSLDDEYWSQIRLDWQAALEIDPASCLVSGRPMTEAWTLIELLCTDQKYRGHGIGKLLLGAALAYSLVKDGRTSAVLTLAHGDENVAAKALYEKVGFEEMPKELFSAYSGTGPEQAPIDPSHVMVIWDIKRSLKSLTLGDLISKHKGLVVPQLESDAIRPLDSQGCTEVVDRLHQRLQG